MPFWEDAGAFDSENDLEEGFSIVSDDAESFDFDSVDFEAYYHNQH